MSANFAELVFFVIFVILVLGFFGNRNRDGKVMSTGCFGFLLKLAGVLGLAMFLFSLFLGTKQWVEGLPYHIGDFVAGLVGDGSADQAYASCLLQQSGSLRGTVAKGGKSVPIATAEAGCFGFSWTQIGKCRETYLKSDSAEPDEVGTVVTSCGSGQAAFSAIKNRIDAGAHSWACTFLPEKQSCEAGLVPRPPQRVVIRVIFVCLCSRCSFSSAASRV